MLSGLSEMIGRSCVRIPNKMEALIRDLPSDPREMS
jgi:hypothetical protein